MDFDVVDASMMFIDRPAQHTRLLSNVTTYRFCDIKGFQNMVFRSISVIVDDGVHVFWRHDTSIVEHQFRNNFKNFV